MVSLAGSGMSYGKEKEKTEVREKAKEYSQKGSVEEWESKTKSFGVSSKVVVGEIQ